MTFTRQEVQSGVFVTICFVLLTVLTFKVSDFQSLSKTVEYQVNFDYIAGLEVNAPVHFAGHSVGIVKSVTIQETSPVVKITIAVDKRIPIRKDSEVFVDTLGLLGEKFISVTPGSPESERLEEGGILDGQEPYPIHQMIRQMNELTESLLPITKSANTLLVGHEKDLEGILTNLNETSANLKEMTADLKRHPWKLLRKK